MVEEAVSVVALQKEIAATSSNDRMQWTKFTTKLLEDSDESDVRRIYAATFARHNDAEFTSAWNRRNRRYSMGLFYKATLIGFGIVVTDQTTNKLTFLAVDAAYRGSGAGSQLLESLLATVEHCYLVPVNNLKVIDWYQRHGFIKVAANRLYAPDEAHFIMTYSPTYSRSPDTITLPSPGISREGSEISVIAI